MAHRQRLHDDLTLAVLGRGDGLWDAASEPGCADQRRWLVELDDLCRDSRVVRSGRKLLHQQRLAIDARRNSLSGAAGYGPGPHREPRFAFGGGLCRATRRDYRKCDLPGADHGTAGAIHLLAEWRYR